MTETSINYAKALYGLSVPGEAICETGRIFKNTPEIGKMLENPLVSLKEKEQVIERVFPQEMKSFLKVTCIRRLTESERSLKLMMLTAGNRKEFSRQSFFM